MIAEKRLFSLFLLWVTGLVALQDGTDLAHAACHFILQVQALATNCRVSDPPVWVAVLVALQYRMHPSHAACTQPA